MKNLLIHFGLFVAFTLVIAIFFLFTLVFVFDNNVLHALAGTVIAGIGFFTVTIFTEVTNLSNQIFELKQMLEEMKNPTKQKEEKNKDKTEYTISKF